MIGSIIGGALQLGSTIFGGVKAAREAKRQRQDIAAREAENTNIFNRRYNEDATQRADAQRMLELTRERMRDANRQAAGHAAVGGGTEESLAATKAANAKAMGDAAAQIAAAGAANKNAAEAQYLNRRDALSREKAAASAAKSQAIAQAAQGVAGAAGGIASAFIPDGKGKSKGTAAALKGGLAKAAKTVAGAVAGAVVPDVTTVDVAPDPDYDQEENGKFRGLGAL